MDPILNSETKSPKYGFLKATNYKIGALIVVLLVVNIIVIQMIPFENYLLQNSDGSTLTANEMRKISIKRIILLIPFFGLILGIILSFIPFKNINYKLKYLRFSLIVILLLYTFNFVSNLNLIF